MTTPPARPLTADAAQLLEESLASVREALTDLRYGSVAITVRPILLRLIIVVLPRQRARVRPRVGHFGNGSGARGVPHQASRAESSVWPRSR